MLTEVQETFVYFIHERESIRLRKESGLHQPWTVDPILNDYYFCNINREDDKTTKYIREHFNLEAWPNHGEHIAVTTMARLFNRIDFFEYLPSEAMGNICDFKEWLHDFHEFVVERQSKGLPCWSSAYIIRTSSGVPKADYCKQIIWDVYDKFKSFDPFEDWTNLKSHYEELKTIFGLGPFLAAQIVADLKYTEGHALELAEDWFSFSAQGPGSLRGIAHFFGERPSSSMTEENWAEHIDRAWAIVYPYLDVSVRKICRDFQNFQNCFCEFDKYYRTLEGNGRPKRRYRK